MGKQVIKLTESQIREMVAESVANILKESEMDEGFLDNLKAGWNGAKSGYNTQKFTDSDINTDYANPNANYDNMLNGVKSKEDAAKAYSKMIQIARNYEAQAKNLRAKMNDVYSKHGIDKVYSRNNGKFTGGYGYQDNSKSSGFNPNFVSKEKEISNRRADVASQQKTAVQAGMSPSGTLRRESKEPVRITESQIRQVVAESVYNVLKESKMDEGFLDNLKAGWNGMKQGWKTQSALDTDNSRFQNDAERRQNDMYHGNNALDAIANKIYYKDAKSSGEKMYAMAKQYDAMAKQIREKAKQLAAKWGVTNIAPVGAKQKYGYTGKPVVKPGTATA